jgi:hypothetical protein
MYCSNCGKEIAENMKFCPYCGTPLNSGVTNNQDKASLVIKRTEKDAGGIIKIAVAIDGTNLGKLKRGESLQTVVSEGAHKITATLNAQSQSLMFINTGDPIVVSYDGFGVSISLPDGKGGYVSNKTNVETVGNNTKDETLSAAAIENPVMSYEATSPYGNKGKLNIYTDHLDFLYQNGTVTTFDFADISDWEKTFSGISIYKDGKPHTFKLPRGAANDIVTFLKTQSPDRWKAAHPESVFSKRYGIVDQILVNEEYGSFCIKPYKKPNGPTHYFANMINYEVQETKAEGGDVIEGALIGSLIAGKRGALAGALLQPTGRGNIQKEIFRATIQENGKTSTVQAYLMNQSVSENSDLYISLRAQIFELQNIIERFKTESKH